MPAKTSKDARERFRTAFNNLLSRGSITEEPEYEMDDETEVFTDASGFRSTRSVVTFTRGLEHAEFGRFNLWVFAISGGVIAVMQLLPIYLAYKAPSVECDLHFFDNKSRSFINVMVYIGLTLGALVTGILADLIQRNFVLIGALCLNLGGTILIALKVSYTTFWLGRLLASFGGSGAVVVALVMLAEYNLPQHRGAAMCSLQLCWVIGTVLGPVLNLHWRNTAILSCVLTVVLICGVLGLPENPRHLLTSDDPHGAFMSLRVMYAYNTGNEERDYPPQGIRDNESLYHLRSRVEESLIPQYMKPRCYTYLLLIVMQFFLMFSYYCLMPYFPDLPSRYDSFYDVRSYSHAGLRDSCALNAESGNMFSDPDLQESHRMDAPDQRGGENDANDDCYPPTSPQVYNERRLQQFVMVTFAAIPAIVWLVLSIDSQGRKFFVAFAHVIAAALIYSSYFLMFTRYDLVFACGFQAMVTCSVAASQLLMVELAFTRCRATLLAFWFLGGYAGLVLGNWGLCMAVQISCNILLGVLGILVSFTGMFTFVFPNTVGMPLRS